MEENVQRVFSVMIAVIVFFLLPMYVAFEKKDDTSYALAVRVTSELVENIKNNGYFSKQMYDDYMSKLSVTGNTYEVKLEHKSYNYTPVICSYTDNTYRQLRETFEYDRYRAGYTSGTINYNANVYTNLVLTYAKNEEIYTEDQIFDILSREASTVYTGMTREAYAAVGINDIPLEPSLYNSGIIGPVYALNKGDEFNIRIRNTNTTTAELFFNTLTAGMATTKIPRVYVNYGCVVQAEKYKTWVVANSGYTGNMQQVTITETGNYVLEVWGASGAGNDPASTILGSRGGQGGYAKGQKFLTEGTILYVYTGGKGNGTLGGYNGGANGGVGGNGGGGATDIRTIGGAWNDATSLASRLIVAGGGGGADSAVASESIGVFEDGSGGDGGAAEGDRGYINGIVSNSTTYPNALGFNVSCALGGNQVGGSGLRLGYSENVSVALDAGGGGGGYYGGLSSQHQNGGGGGGSGYVGGVSSSEMRTGVNTGNGSFRITFLN